MSTQSLTLFKELGISDEILVSIEKSGFLEPTAIQIKTLPMIFSNMDLLIEAQTGSGKTACYAWPILQKLSSNKNADTSSIGALVLAPTRELALQISGAFFRFGEFQNNKLSVLPIIGGESISQQTIALTRGVDIVVATPGRLLDLIGQNCLSLENIKFLVIDEADKILDQGFAVELDLVLNEISKDRQNLFFSATYPEKVIELVKKISTTPEHIKIDSTTPTVENISQRVILVNRENRGMLLRHLIQTEKWKHALVFVSSKVAANNLFMKLKKAGFNAGTIHGDLSQSERNMALTDFKNGKLQFLIATDVAGRGIDISKLELVINFDLPRSPADYIHRIGRTGRAGESGLAISFVGHEDQDHFHLIEKRAEIYLEREVVVGFELRGLPPEKKIGLSPIKGKRKSKKDKKRENEISEKGVL